MKTLPENTPKDGSRMPSTVASPAVKHDRNNPWPTSMTNEEFADLAVKEMVANLNRRAMELPDPPGPTQLDLDLR